MSTQNSTQWHTSVLCRYPTEYLCRKRFAMYGKAINFASMFNPNRVPRWQSRQLKKPLWSSSGVSLFITRKRYGQKETTTKESPPRGLRRRCPPACRTRGKAVHPARQPRAAADGSHQLCGAHPSVCHHTARQGDMGSHSQPRAARATVPPHSLLCHARTDKLVSRNRRGVPAAREGGL